MVDAFNLSVMKPILPLVLQGSSALTNFTFMAADPQPGVKSTFSGVGYVIVDLGANTTIQQVFVGYTTGTSLGQVRARASTTNDGVTAAVFDMTYGGAVPEFGGRPSGYRHYLFTAAAPVTARYVRVDFSVGMDVGILAIGPVIQPQFNADYGETSWGYEEADGPDLLDSGVEVLYDTPAAPYLKFQLGWVTEAEMKADWEPLGRLQHEGTPVVVCRDPTQPPLGGYGHNATYYGRLRMTPIIAADFDMYEVQGQIRSMV